MADFSPQDLVDEAKARFGESVLRERVAPGAAEDVADLVLLNIARSVISRVAGAVQSSVGWPLPGAWPFGSFGLINPQSSALTADLIDPLVFTVPVAFISGTLTVYDDGDVVTEGLEYDLVGNIVTFVAPPTGPVTATWALDLSGIPYSSLWPAELLQRAMDLFLFRTYQREEVIPDVIRDLGKATEKYFLDLARGLIGLGLMVDTDTSRAEMLSARDRQGRNLLNDGAADADRLIDEFTGRAWDFQ